MTMIITLLRVMMTKATRDDDAHCLSRHCRATNLFWGVELPPFCRGKSPTFIPVGDIVVYGRYYPGHGDHQSHLQAPQSSQQQL